MTVRVATTLEPEFLIDTEAINKRLRETKEDPRRWFVGSFFAPYDCVYKSDSFRALAKERTSRFIDAMRKKGWDIIEAPQVFGPFEARNIDSGAVLLDQKEYRVRAVFQLQETPKLIRDEVPSGLVKRDPEHTITLKQAIAAR